MTRSGFGRRLLGTRKLRRDKPAQPVRAGFHRARLEQMESREAPQWTLPAMGAIGATAAAVAAQMFVQHAAAVEFVDIRIADGTDAADSAKLVETRAAQTRFVVATDMASSDLERDDFLPNLGALDSDLSDRKMPAAPRGDFLAAASFDGGESNFGHFGTMGERPFDTGNSPTIGASESGGGGDNPSFASKPPSSTQNPARPPDSPHPTSPPPSSGPTTPPVTLPPASCPPSRITCRF